MAGKKKQTAWQKAFSGGFTGKTMGLSKKESQAKKLKEMREKKKRDQEEMNKRGY